MNAGGRFTYLGNNTEHSSPRIPDQKKLQEDLVSKIKVRFDPTNGSARSSAYSAPQMEYQMKNGVSVEESGYVEQGGFSEADFLYSNGYDSLPLMDSDGRIELNPKFAFSPSQLCEEPVRLALANQLDEMAQYGLYHGKYFKIDHPSDKHGASSWLAAEIMAGQLREFDSEIKYKTSGKAHQYSSLVLFAEKDAEHRLVTDFWIHYAEVFLQSENIPGNLSAVNVITGDPAVDIITLAGYFGITPDQILGRNSVGGVRDIGEAFRRTYEKYNRKALARAYEDTYRIFQAPFEILDPSQLAVDIKNPVIANRSNGIDLLTCDIARESAAYECIVRDLKSAMTPVKNKSVIIMYEPTAVIDSVARKYIKYIKDDKGKKVRKEHTDYADFLHACRLKYASDAIATIFMQHSLLVLPEGHYLEAEARFLEYGRKPKKGRFQSLLKEKSIDINVANLPQEQLL